MSNSNKPQKVSIIIPVYNEAENILSVVDRVNKSMEKLGIDYEIICIDDNSSDGTCDHLQKCQINKLKVYKKVGKKGKAYSLTEGFSYSTGDILCMIDGDLQYPPEQIPEMVLKLQNADIVVAKRKVYKDSTFRKMISSSFRIFFGKILFGLEQDIQSGLKVFKREVLETIQYSPQSAWTFDLGFLYEASRAGFSITSHDTFFHRRTAGQSKVNFFKQALEIGSNALLLKVRNEKPIDISSSEPHSMVGAGLRYKQKKYTTHTSLPHRFSALRVFSSHQKLFFAVLLGAFAVGFFLIPLKTALLLVAVLSTVYFFDTVFHLYIILKSLHNTHEIKFSEEELASLDLFPVYSILCPLYKEWQVVPQFLQSIQKLDWPKNKLDVILLLEEDDHETIRVLQQMQLPSYVRTIVVPDSFPKTKPKACNYGLSYAFGEYIVIYDAEDIPDPLQLKKAYRGFQKSDDRIVCLQSKLNFYNKDQNLLTRLFTAEYSLWFDIFLTGLQSLSTSIPLGGTSNHFKTQTLMKLKGWDPFNVTEDADLGVRLFKQGYKTAIIDSTTYEEANSNLKNWLRQRSRWIKGYMQTFLVHNRDVFSFFSEKGIHALIFQLIIGGKIAFILINPILWIATISYFALYSIVGSTIETLYPALVFYMALISLVFGNFLFIYYYMIGCMKREQWNLIKYVFLVPLYWLLISVSGVVALYQLVFKPHYWEKTIHGLHLKPGNDQIAQMLVTVQEDAVVSQFPIPLKKWLRKVMISKTSLVGGGFLVIALNVANVLNFVFNSYLGRVLSLHDFALVSLIGSFLYFFSTFSNSFSATVNYKSSFLIGKYTEDAGFSFWKYIRKYSWFLGILLTLSWILFSPFLTAFFKAESIVPFLFFSPVIFLGFTSAVDRGYLSSRLFFISLAMLTIIEPLTKLFSALFFSAINPHGTYISIPLSLTVAFFIGWYFAIRDKKTKTEKTNQEIRTFPKKFFLIIFISGLSTISFLSLDLILVNHYLTSQEAGKYALIALVGKMIYFLGNFSSPFIIPLVSRNEGARKSSANTLTLGVLSTFLLTFLGFLALGLFGTYFLPMLYGQKVVSVLPYVALFCYAMMTFAIARVFISYYLAKKMYTFPVVSFLLSVCQVVLIALRHNTLEAIVEDMAIIGSLNYAAMLLLHVLKNYVFSFENNFADFVGLFTKHPQKEKNVSDKLSVLIFNWRDTKHAYSGGAEVYIHEMAKNWAKKNHKVTLFCGNDGQHAKYEMVDGVEVIRRGGFYFVYVWAFFYYLFKLRGNYDVIIDCENGIPFFTPLYATEKIFLLIYHVHQDVFRKSLKWPMNDIASFMEKRLMPPLYSSSQVITISPSSKKEILEHQLTRKDPKIIYSGVDLNKYKPAKKNETPLVLYLGRLKYYKSLHVFLKAAKKILTTFSPVEFIIAGSGEEEKGLKKLTQELGIEKNVSFLGKVSEEEKINLYQKAWVFVNPSMIEGWGVTTIEANACGTPVVASNVSGLKDSIKNPHTGYLVSYGDVDQFATKILTLITDNSLREELSQDAIKWAREFDWEKTASEFLVTITESLHDEILVSVRESADKNL